MNWFFFITVQSVVMFRRTLLLLWKKLAFIFAGTVSGICSSIIFILSVLLGIAFICGKEGSNYLSEYQSDHIFPLVNVICLEFAELIVVLFNYFLVKHMQLEKSKTAKVELVIEKIETLMTRFKKPNLAMIQ